MRYKFGYLPLFGKELKALSKKYKGLKKDSEALKEEIEDNPEMGVSLRGGIREARLNITSKNKGKRGGARVVTHEVPVEMDSEETTPVVFVSIYDESEYDTIGLDIVRKMVKKYRGEA